MSHASTPAVRIAGLLVLLAVSSGCSPRAGSPARIATGYISHVVCSYVFVSGLDPARALGGFESRAVYRDALGCLNLNGPRPADAPTRAEVEADGPVPVLLPDPAGPAIVAPTEARLSAALDRAFAEPDGRPVRLTHAVVVVHDGRVVAERYADRFGIDTPMHGWSATKSVNNALVGILVRQGKLRMEDRAPVAAWQAPGDPRRAITPDHLLRMESGLELGDSLTASFSTAWDTSARMVFNEPDMAGFAEGAPLGAAPGTRWSYANGNPAILARIVRDRVGGHAVDVLRFARRELFGPLGIRRATLELDATGTPIAGAYLFATPRECAFMALGIYGQAVVVVRSARLVITRFGTTYDLRMAMVDLCRLTADTVAALR